MALLPAPIKNLYRLKSAKIELNPEIQETANQLGHQIVKRVASNYSGATDSTRPFTAYEGHNRFRFNDRATPRTIQGQSNQVLTNKANNQDNELEKSRQSTMPRTTSSYPLNSENRNSVLQTETDKHQFENAYPDSFRQLSNVEVINIADKLQDSASKIKQVVNPFDHSYRQILLNGSKSSGALQNRPISEYLVRIIEGKKATKSIAGQNARPLTSIMPMAESPSAQFMSRQVTRVKLYSANQGHSNSHKNLANAIGEVSHDLKSAQNGLLLPGSTLLNIKKPKPRVTRRRKPTNKPKLR